ncbi:amidohydrolase family protein [Hydrogenophaga sp.]|uniref:amidohydrolase family protein n=1 Tax=Hydrogenophaga sp. TaxID=1904254 RepID=UPI003F6E5E70
MSESPYVRFSCGCVDIHTHVVPQQFPKYMGRHPDARWPVMAPAKPCHQHVMLGGAVYRTVSHQAWDLEVRLADMERMNVERQVLSPMPELLSYWLTGEDGAAMCRFLNETIAAMVQSAPGRFSGLAAVPMQDPQLAIDELHFSIRELGLAGVEIGSNINGTPIGDPLFLPFFQACEKLGAAVFVHPLRPAGLDRIVGKPNYEQVVAFPGEIGLAAISMMTGGTLAAVPGLRIAFSHGGGSLQVQVPRLQKAWEVLPAVREAMAEAPREAAKRMFYDDLLYDATAIAALVRLAGPSQVMVGTDYPFTIMDSEPAQRVESIELDEAVREALRHTNARRWLGLPPAD